MMKLGRQWIIVVMCKKRETIKKNKENLIF